MGLEVSQTAGSMMQEGRGGAESVVYDGGDWSMRAVGRRGEYERN